MYIFFSGDTCHQAEAALTPAVNEQIPRLYYQTVTVVGVFVFDRILEYANITAPQAQVVMTFASFLSAATAASMLW